MKKIAIKEYDKNEKERYWNKTLKIKLGRVLKIGASTLCTIK